MTIRGADWFAAECTKAGVDGVICVDIPPEEDPELGPALRERGISLIRLATPTTDDARLPAVLAGNAVSNLIRNARQAIEAARCPTCGQIRRGTLARLARRFGVVKQSMTYWAKEKSGHDRRS